MVSEKHTISPAMTSNNSSRYIPKEDHEDRKKRSTGWTEVTSKQSKRNPNVNDPFAGMKSCVDYEQEIERLKQIVPKVPRQTTKQSHHPHQEISRSNSPDTTHSSDSEASLPEPQPVISKEEKARFLSFVRSWAGDCKGGYGHNDDELMNNNSLWAEQSPWTARPQPHHYHGQQHQKMTNPLIISMPHSNTPINTNINSTTSYNQFTNNTAAKPAHDITHHDLYWQIDSTPTPQPIVQISPPSSYSLWQTQPYPTSTRHGQQPIGMGRSSLRGRTNSPFFL